MKRSARHSAIMSAMNTVYARPVIVFPSAATDRKVGRSILRLWGLDEQREHVLQRISQLRSTKPRGRPRKST
jgi:hypothetical protein